MTRSARSIGLKMLLSLRLGTAIGANSQCHENVKWWRAFYAAAWTAKPCHSIDGEDASTVEVFLGSGGGVFTLFVNGRVSLTGKERADLFVERWPAAGGERTLSLRSRQEWHPQEENPNWWVGGE